MKISKQYKFGLLLVLVFCLVCVRVFLEPFLYDPLVAYFKLDYLKLPIPDLNLGFYLLNISLRYLTNTIISLAIIYVIFQKKEIVLFSFKIFIVVFLILFLLLFLSLTNYVGNDYLIIFYVRRFLIHPVIVLLLVPAFYYQQLREKK